MLMLSIVASVWWTWKGIAGKKRGIIEGLLLHKFVL